MSIILFNQRCFFLTKVLGDLLDFEKNERHVNGIKVVIGNLKNGEELTEIDIKVP